MTEPDYLTTTRAAYDTVAVDFAELLSRDGLVVHTRVLREPDGSGVEKTQQVYLLAHKPV